MGDVLEAEHTRLLSRVAVKLLKEKWARDPGLCDRLRLEAQALASLRHPHVVAVHDHAIAPDGRPFVVMELLHGRTLQDEIRRRGALPLPEALHWMDQILDGLRAIHAAGLVHRDLKPENVFLAEERGRTVVKLLDLGVVKVVAEPHANRVDRRAAPAGPAPLACPTAEGFAIGTPRFMSPEQALGQPCTVRADIYAAGLILHTMLAGRGPFEKHRTLVAVLAAHVGEPPEPVGAVAPQPVPTAIEGAILRALAKRPADRFGSVDEFAAALLESKGGTAPMPRSPAQGGTWKLPALARGAQPASPAAPRGAPGGGTAPLLGGPASVAPAATEKIVTGRPAPRFGLPDAAPLGPIAAKVAGAAAAAPEKASRDAEVAGAPGGRSLPRAPARGRGRRLLPLFRDPRLVAIAVLLGSLVAAVAWSAWRRFG
jgi:serine/threonine-protein kinase